MGYPDDAGLGIDSNLSDKPLCARCGKDDAMILGEDGEWVCHHTHPIIEDDMNVLAIEDLVTVVCETFVENLDKLGYNAPDENAILLDWYINRTDDSGRRAISEKLMDIIDKGMVEPSECKHENTHHDEDGECCTDCGCDTSGKCSCRA